jgi:hypothetical protein
MSFRQMGEDAGKIFWAPLLWWQTLCEAHFQFLDEMLAAAEVDARRSRFHIVRR